MPVMKSESLVEEAKQTLVAAAAIQDAEAHQRLLDIAAQADAREGIRQGLEDVRKGRTRSVEDFFRDFEAAHGISR